MGMRASDLDHRAMKDVDSTVFLYTIQMPGSRCTCMKWPKGALWEEGKPSAIA